MDRTQVKDTAPRKGQSARDMPDACQIFVGGLPPGSTEADLREVFSEFGSIMEIRVNPKNFAFVVFNNPESVQKIIQEKERLQIRSKSLNIEPKRPSAPRPSGMSRSKPGVTAGAGGKPRSAKPPKR